MITERRWKAIVLLGMIAVPTAVMSGMLQIERCPHATYVQVIGINIPVVGKGCHNPRDSTVWWLRD